MNKNKGFTLIELLVVIAIIGILASVVLASLSSARNKGKDAAVKSQLASMRAQAELYNSTVGNYIGICAAASTANGFGGDAGPGLIKAVKDSEGVLSTVGVTLTTGGDYNIITCHEAADGSAWAVDAPLTGSVSGTPKMHCVDSAGASKEKTSALVADAVSC